MTQLVDNDLTKTFYFGRNFLFRNSGMIHLGSSYLNHKAFIGVTRAGSCMLSLWLFHSHIWSLRAPATLSPHSVSLFHGLPISHSLVLSG